MTVQSPKYPDSLEKSWIAGPTSKTEYSFCNVLIEQSLTTSSPQPDSPCYNPAKPTVQASP